MPIFSFFSFLFFYFLSFFLFFFFFEKFLLFKPPWSKQTPGLSHSPAWLSPKNPAADPCPGGGLQPPWSLHCSQDLIVLKHSSYPLIFQCPLSLVSVLHIYWNIVGCSLCSLDQLGVSLVPEGKWTLVPPISPPSSP